MSNNDGDKIIWKMWAPRSQTIESLKKSCQLYRRTVVRHDLIINGALIVYFGSEANECRRSQRIHGKFEWISPKITPPALLAHVRKRWIHLNVEIRIFFWPLFWVHHEKQDENWRITNNNKQPKNEQCYRHIKATRYNWYLANQSLLIFFLVVIWL